MKNLKRENLDKCPHENVKRDGRFLVCQDCGLILEDTIQFSQDKPSEYYIDSDLDYERNIRIKDSKAMQSPTTYEKYRHIKVLKTWYKDYESFAEQRKTIELLKNYGINIDQVKYQNIKKRYLKYNRMHRRKYQNLVIIFLAIVWLEIKETIKVRIEKYIEILQELGHKINKKMLNNAMLKVKKTEKMWKKYKTTAEIEKEIKERIKILFQKDLNSIPYLKVKEHIPEESDYDKLKIEMQLLANKLLNKITYDNLKNLNYKAFTAGLIYYIGQTLDNRKIFTQSIIEETTTFSSTTIRKKYNILKDILN